MVVDKELAKIILNECCRGLSYDEGSRCYTLDIIHIDSSLLSKLKNEAKCLGYRLHRDDLNVFLMDIENDNSYLLKTYSTPLFDTNIQVGEILQIYLDSFSSYIEVLKVASHEFLVVKSTDNLENVQFIRIAPETILGTDLHMQFSLLSPKHKILRIDFIMPTQNHRCLDFWLMPDLRKHEVLNNIWPLYNEVKQYIDDSTLCRHFYDLTKSFAEAGLSMFVFRKMIKSILNYGHV